MNIMTNEIIYQQQIQKLKESEKSISKVFFVDKTFNPTPLEEKALRLANTCDFEICEVRWNSKKAYVLYSLILERYMCENLYDNIDKFLESCSVSQIKDIHTIMETYCINRGFDYDKVCDENILNLEQCCIDEISNLDFKKLKSEVEKLHKATLDANQLKNEVEKLNLAINKTIDLVLVLQKKVSDLQEDSFLTHSISTPINSKLIRYKIF